MKIFRSVQRQYVIVGISSSRQPTNFNSFNKRIVFGFLLFECVIVSHFVYIFHVASDFMEYVNCICATSASIIIFVCLAAIVLRKTTLFESIDNMEKLIDTRCKYPKSEAFFFKTSQQIERLCGIVFMVVVKISLQFVMAPKCIVSYGDYFITDIGSDSFQLPLPMWFPFDSNNPIGYLIAVILEYIILGYEYFMIACTLALGIGVFWFAISATKEIQRILHSINEKTQTSKNQSTELKILFSEFIHAHATIKQVESDFSDIFQPIIMSLFTWSLLAISGALLIIQVDILQHGNVLPLLLMIVSGIFALALVFIACEIGQRMNDAFDEINYTIDQFDWYLFPIKINRMLPMIIAIAQQPVLLECFGSVTCVREIFRKVIHCAFSYFMVLRQLGD